MKNEEFDNLFRRIATILLALTIITIPLFTTIAKISADNYNSLVNELGEDAEELKDKKPFSLTMGIYRYNCFLLGVSLIASLVYFTTKWGENKKAPLKDKLKRNWPCILLAVFMAWTLVGCIQAGMEMDAEIKIKTSASIDEVPERIIKIANWSSGDRMSNLNDMYQNAKSRAWNGCENLKDGYLSFMFYASVLLNVLMLGKDAENHKKWLLRALLITSLIMVILNVLSFFAPEQFYGVIQYQKNIFNNSNHYAYYITVVLTMSAIMLMLEDNLYFKGLAFINCLLYIPVLIFNNTYGAYIGVACGLVFIGIVALVRLLTRKKVTEFVLYAVVLVMFIIFSNTIVGINNNLYRTPKTDFSYCAITIDVPGKNTLYLSHNSISVEKAKELGLTESPKVKWGNQIREMDELIPPLVQRTFEVTCKDAVKFLGLAKVDETEEPRIITQAEFNSKVAEITAKYPKASGETFDDYSARQEKIENEINTFIAENNLLDGSGNLKLVNSSNDAEKNESKDELDEEIAKTGSGRGAVWMRSLDLMNQRPLFGWGLENVLIEFVNQFGVNEGRTHNLVLQLGATTGIVGVALYLIATISIWLKVLFDVKLREYSKNQLYIILASFAIIAIILNVIMKSFTNKLFIIGMSTVALWAILYAIVFIKKIKLRIHDWNKFEYIGSAVFVSYMISSLFGNSAFYTSPYFMIFLGILTYEMLNKTPRFEEEKEGAEK